MSDRDPNTSHPSVQGSIIGALLLGGIDAATGSFLVSMFICPIWLISSLIKSSIQEPPLKTAVVRAFLPLLTLAIVVANSSLQSRIARANAESVIAACEQFRAYHGRYPDKLQDLVPQYLDDVPRAKYCAIWNEFWYLNGRRDPLLVWVDLPPFGRSTYRFQDKRWGYLN